MEIMTKERPIIFSGEMVRAILDGSKTQTRRVMKPQPWKDEFGDTAFTPEGPGLFWPAVIDRHGEEHPANEQAFGVWSPEGEWAVKCPYGQPGDRLWVRETHCVQRAGNIDGSGRRIVYKADDQEFPYGWTPSIYMPRLASRITLEITGVRVERLQDISLGDAMNEGCPYPNMADGPDPRIWLMSLWESINGYGSWDSNPWVWVVEFKKITP